MKQPLIHTRTHAHTSGTANSENPTGVRKKRTKRTTIRKCLINSLKTRGYKKKEKRTKSEPKANWFANQNIDKSEPKGNKKANKIKEVRFLVRFGSLFERTGQIQSYQGLRGSFKSRFAWFAFSDTHPPIL